MRLSARGTVVIGASIGFSIGYLLGRYEVSKWLNANSGTIVALATLFLAVFAALTFRVYGQIRDLQVQGNQMHERMVGVAKLAADEAQRSRIAEYTPFLVITKKLILASKMASTFHAMAGSWGALLHVEVTNMGRGPALDVELGYSSDGAEAGDLEWKQPGGPGSLGGSGSLGPRATTDFYIVLPDELFGDLEQEADKIAGFWRYMEKATGADAKPEGPFAISPKTPIHLKARCRDVFEEVSEFTAVLQA